MEDETLSPKAPPPLNDEHPASHRHIANVEVSSRATTASDALFKDRARDYVALDLLADAASSAASNPASPVHGPIRNAEESVHPPALSQSTQRSVPNVSEPSRHPPPRHPFPRSYPRLPPPFPTSSPPQIIHQNRLSVHPHSAPPPRSAFDIPATERVPPRTSISVHGGSAHGSSLQISHSQRDYQLNPGGYQTPPISAGGDGWQSQCQLCNPCTSCAVDARHSSTLSSTPPRSWSYEANLDKHASNAPALVSHPVETNAWTLAPPVYAISAPSSSVLQQPAAVPLGSTGPQALHQGMTSSDPAYGHASATSLPRRQHSVPIPRPQVQPTTYSKSGRRTSYLRFTPEEERMLEHGVRIFGHGNWKRILNAYAFHSKRSPVDLKDKWRNLNRSKAKKAARMASVASNPDLNVLSASDISEASSGKTPPSLGSSPVPRIDAHGRSVHVAVDRAQVSERRETGNESTQGDVEMRNAEDGDADDPMMPVQPCSV